MKFFIKKSRAQGILEVVIAIYIAVVGILSIMNLVLASIKVERMNHNMLIATNLAREGIEVARNIRDSNWISGASWDSGLLPAEPSGRERSFIINNNYLSADKSGYNLFYFDSSWSDCENGEYLSPCKIWLVSKDNNTENPKISYSQNLEMLMANRCDFSESGSDCVISSTNFYRMIYIYGICYDPVTLLLEDRELINKSTESCNMMFPGSEEIGLYVVSMVGWKEGDSSKSISVSERIYNWK